MAKYSILVTLIAACGSPHTTAPDAPPIAPDAQLDAPRPPDDAPSGPNLSCLGQPPPTTAPDPVALAGKVFAIDHYAIAPLAGATVAVHRRADDVILASAVTASDGTFATTVTSHGNAIDAYFTIAATGLVGARLDPIVPLAGGDLGLMLIASDAEIGRWYTDANATYTPGIATLIVAASDCDRMALAGTTETVAPGAPITYYDDVAKRWDPTLATSTNGYTLVVNPAASVVVTPHRGATSYPSHAIAAPPNTLTVVTIMPYQ